MRNIRNETPLYLAVTSGDVGTIRALLSEKARNIYQNRKELKYRFNFLYQANIICTSCDGRLPFDFGISNGEIEEVLFAKYQDPHLVSRSAYAIVRDGDVSVTNPFPSLSPSLPHTPTFPSLPHSPSLPHALTPSFSLFPSLSSK